MGKREESISIQKCINTAKGLLYFAISAIGLYLRALPTTFLIDIHDPSTT
jgi:hypothetical protein